MTLPRLLSRAGDLASGMGGAVLTRVQHLRLPGVGGASVRDDPERSARRWRAVTVLCSPEQVGVGADLPPPLAAFGDRVELRVTPAPGDKGTELAARFRGPASREELGGLRRALREAKQLVEVGEVLRVDPRPHGTRKPTPQGALLEGVARRAPEEGVL